MPIDNKTLAFPQSGMNRDKHPSTLNEQEYTFALNANIESEDGNINMRSNENANMLFTRFVGFKVLGYKNDLSTGYTYFFLVNPETKESRIDFVKTEINLEDMPKLTPYLAVMGLWPLVEKEQIYNLIRDSEKDPCLNFSINHPIKTIEIKVEKCGKCIYWTDGYNPPRYVIVDKALEPDEDGDLWYQYHGYKICGDDKPLDRCVLACEKLRVFPELIQPSIEPAQIEYGGSLRAGVYQFAVALCDEFGIESTSYSALTNPVHIFDRQNIRIEDGKWGARTNHGIRLVVSNIDRQASHFKVAVIQNTVGYNGETQPVVDYFIEGIHPVTEKTILYYSDLNNERTTFEHIAHRKPVYTTSEGMVAVGKRLLQYGLTAEKEWNLQPVVSLMGHFLRWQRSVASEDLYQDGKACSLYVGYMRDEVYPFGISFKTNTGYKTPVFTLIPPPSMESRNLASKNIDIATPYESINKYVSNCSGIERKYVWQYINNAGKSEWWDLPPIIENPYEDGGCKNIGYIGQTDVVESDFDRPYFRNIYFDIKDVNVGDINVYFSRNIKDIVCDYEGGTSEEDQANKKKMDDICELFTSYETYNKEGLSDKLQEIDHVDIPVFPEQCTDVRRENSVLSVPLDKIKGVNVKISYTSFKDLIETSNEYIYTMGGEDNQKYSILFDNNTLLEMREFVDKIFLNPNGYLNEDTMAKRQPEALLNGAANNVNIASSIICSCGCSVKEPCVNPYIYKEGYTVFQPKAIFMAGKINPTNSWLVGSGSHTDTMLDKCYYNYKLINESHKSYYTDSVEQEFIEKFTDVRFNVRKLDNERPGAKVVPFDRAWHKFRFDGVSSSFDMTRFDGPERTNSRFASGVGLWKFYDTIGKNANWVEVNKPDFWEKGEGPEYIVIELFGRITGMSDAASTPYIRLSFWEDLEGTPLDLPGGEFGDFVKVEDDNGEEYSLYSSNSRVYNTSTHDIETITKKFLEKTAGGGKGIDKFYISIDTPVLVTSWIMAFREDNYSDGKTWSTAIFGYSYLLSKIPNPYVIGIRDREIDSYRVNIDRFEARATVTFAARCETCGDAPLNCAPRFHDYGEFAYWESSEKYPANYELYDSSRVRVNPYIGDDDDIDTIAYLGVMTKLSSYYGDFNEDENGYLYFTGKKSGNVETSTVFCQQPIRHYKFPDNHLAPFMNSDARSLGTQSEIYPIGVLIDDRVIKVFLKFAVDSGLITKEQRKSIVGYELYRGDRRLNRSVVAAGLAYDMFRYKDDNGNMNLYSNYPYNDLSDDQYNYESGNRSKFIGYPFSDKGNVWYTFHSPENHFNKFETPTEVTIDGFQRGMSSGVFTSVDEHPKWTILGPKAYQMAKTMANIEATATIASLIAEEMQVRAQSAYVGLVGNLSVAMLFTGMIQAVSQTLAKRPMYYGKYRYDWLNAFIDNGPRLNYAWYYTSVGLYNSMMGFSSDYNRNFLRGLSVVKEMKSGIYPITDNSNISTGGNSDIVYVNNIDRESSIFLSFGDPGVTENKYRINYPNFIANYDNSRVDDPALMGVDNIAGNTQGLNKTVSYIASPYMKLKRYKPDQYGSIEDINWISIGTANNIDRYGRSFFGGDIFISRFSLKRKFPFFYNNAFHVGDMIPFPYDDYRNVGYPKYFVNYDTGDDALEHIDGERFMSWTSMFTGVYTYYPNRKSTYNLNAYDGDKYARGRFYLWFYGIPQFLVESEINCNFRLEGQTPDEWFYPAVGDYVWWTQEKNVSIQRDNDYKISPIYSSRMTLAPNSLPATYERKFYDCAYQRPNGVIWSREDVSENNQTDPWLSYKPVDYHEFPSKNGKLIHMKCIESEQILARFEDQVSLHNAIDVTRERTVATSELGTGGLFASRPLEYNTTDLGYSGTQSTEMVSCEFGHMWVDVKRAQVFMTDPNGRNLHELSIGIKHWLKKHLPFKILKYNITNTGTGRNMEYKDVDNKFAGLGLSLGWDNRYKRFFITKKDYIPVKKSSFYSYEDGQFYFTGSEGKVKISLTDENYFKNVSFTIAYSCTKKEWISYYSFCPDYYIEGQSYFQTGLNFSKFAIEEGLWTHIYSNKFYQRFYGSLYPFQIEVPVKENYKGNILTSVEYEFDLRSYSNDNDYTVYRKSVWDNVVIYNDTNNTGNLKLVAEEKNDMYQRVHYPLFLVDSTHILDTEVYGRHKINDFFNLVDDDTSKLSVWKKDDNDIMKEINNDALNFDKVWKDRMRGSWMLMRMSKEADIAKVIFKWVIGESKEKNR